MRTVRAITAVLGVRAENLLTEPDAQALGTLADQGASAIERVRLTAASARGEAQAETQRLRTALLNSLSHDLRTPLTGIRGAAGTLRAAWDQLDPATRADLLASIEQDTARMARFLANITAMTRLESGEITPRHERADASEIVRAAAERVPGLGALDMKIPADLPYVQVDPELLEQALVDIFENAAKYAGSAARVEVNAEPSDGSVRITIADDGPGIAAHDLPHVFDSFYRAFRQDRTEPGTGLGLAIARGLVEAIGGTVTAVSPRPAAPADRPGTELVIRVPIAP